MPSFSRNPSTAWQREVPGTRWLRADLHIHTLDDHPNSNLRRPHGLSGIANDQATQIKYARAFLKAAIANKIQVLGLTPHAIRSDDDDASCATWRIIEEWNSGLDDDGVPFRDKIFAVFPGFEPSLSDGAAGVHLLFLFDPEIGRDQYLRAFDVVMNGVPAYQNGNLRNTTNDSAGGLRETPRASRCREHRLEVPMPRAARVLENVAYSNSKVRSCRIFRIRSWSRLSSPIIVFLKMPLLLEIGWPVE